MKIKYFAMLIAMAVLLVGMASVCAKSYSTLQEYKESIDYSCQTDSDCVIKNVGECCGYYPSCTNKDAFVNATFVNDICKAGGIGGICGFPSIYSCKCKNNRCIESVKNISNENNQCAVNGDCMEVVCPGRGGFAHGICVNGECILNVSGCGERKFLNLSNGRNAEIKIMPETASARAIERLGQLNFTVELKEVGKGNETRAVYELTGNKQGRFLGIFKIMAKVQAQVDAETGDVKVIKPWWNFLASGV